MLTIRLWLVWRDFPKIKMNRKIITNYGARCDISILQSRQRLYVVTCQMSQERRPNTFGFIVSMCHLFAKTKKKRGARVSTLALSYGGKIGRLVGWLSFIKINVSVTLYQNARRPVTPRRRNQFFWQWWWRCCQNLLKTIKHRNWFLWWLLPVFGQHQWPVSNRYIISITPSSFKPLIRLRIPINCTRVIEQKKNEHPSIRIELNANNADIWSD